MNGLLVGAAVTVALVAAARSTWSPCGLSMLSTITPLGESARGHRWGATASWFVVGAVAGGATLGLAIGALAAGVGLLGLSTTSVVAVGSVRMAGFASASTTCRPARDA